MSEQLACGCEWSEGDAPICPLHRAAPDLLAALEELLRIRGADPYGLNATTIQNAEAAIKKAKLPA